MADDKQPELEITPQVESLYTEIAEETVKQKENRTLFNDQIREDFAANSEQLAALMLTAITADQVGYDQAKSEFREALLPGVVEDFEDTIVNGKR